LVKELQIDVLIPKKKTKLLLSDTFPNRKIYSNAFAAGTPPEPHWEAHNAAQAIAVLDGHLLAEREMYDKNMREMK